MRKNTLNFLVDAVSLVVMFGMIATGLVMRFVLPPGTGGRHGGARNLLWGMGRHDWGDVHFWLAVVIGVLLLVHVALHWAWVCSTLQRLVRGGESAGSKTTTRTRNLYGAGFLVVVVAVFAAFVWIAWIHAVTQHPVGGKHGIETAQPTDHSGETDDGDGLPHPHAGRSQGKGWGSMTLAEFEADTGVPVAVVREGLGLPDTVLPDERLGRLRHQYGFEMSALHAIIESHQEKGEERKHSTFPEK